MKGAKHEIEKDNGPMNAPARKRPAAPRPPFPARPVCAGLAACFGLLLCRPASAADPTTGDCLNASDASLRVGNEHKLRAERAHLLICAAATCPADVRKECLGRVDEVNRQIPTVIFAAKDPSGADITAVKVKMDDEQLTDRLEGIALSVDPGEHNFVFEAAGQTPVTKTLVIQEAQKDRREMVTFGEPPAKDGSSAGASGGGSNGGGNGGKDGTDPWGRPPPDAGASDNSTRRLVGFILGGAGIVGAGVAIYEQVTAVSRAVDSNNAAASPDPATQATANPLHSQALTAQSYAIIIGSLSIVAIGTGVYLVLSSATQPAKPQKASSWRVSPTVGAQRGGLVLEGSW
jgi:hypothetical protein